MRRLYDCTGSVDLSIGPLDSIRIRKGGSNPALFSLKNDFLQEPNQRNVTFAQNVTMPAIRVPAD